MLTKIEVFLVYITLHFGEDILTLKIPIEYPM